MDTQAPPEVEILVDKPFSFAHRGHQVQAFEPAEQPQATTPECAALAIAEGWARPVQASAPAPAPRRAARQAPENKDAAEQRTPADPA